MTEDELPRTVSRGDKKKEYYEDFLKLLELTGVLIGNDPGTGHKWYVLSAEVYLVGPDSVPYHVGNFFNFCDGLRLKFPPHFRPVAGFHLSP